MQPLPSPRLGMEAPPPPPSEVLPTENSRVAEQDDVWDDCFDGPGRESSLFRECTHRENQFHKMGYRDGITEGQKDSAQGGFNIGFRQSVQAGYKWGCIRGITSALATLSGSLREKLVPDVQCRGNIQDVYKSVQEISADDALQMFQGSIVQRKLPGEEQQVTSDVDRAVNSGRLESLSKDLMLLLRECPNIKVSEV